jgi:hypothetical protein
MSYNTHIIYCSNLPFAPWAQRVIYNGRHPQSLLHAREQQLSCWWFPWYLVLQVCDMDQWKQTYSGHNKYMGCSRWSDSGTSTFYRPSSTCGSLPCKHYPTMKTLLIRACTPSEDHNQTKKIPKYAVMLPIYSFALRTQLLLILNWVLKTLLLYLASYPH